MIWGPCRHESVWAPLFFALLVSTHGPFFLRQGRSRGFTRPFRRHPTIVQSKILTDSLVVGTVKAVLPEIALDVQAGDLV